MMNKVDYKLFTTIARMSQQGLLKSMKNFLKKYYSSKSIDATSDYILCKGDIPVMLVAHLDTVFKKPPKNIYYDQEQRVMWSPQGLGADDRAGVFAIMKIIQSGYRPSVCFTTDEEIGGFGAKILVSKYTQDPFDLKYIIQLDRQGINDCVFYACDNIDFQDFVESYGFVSDWGTFSDISTICPVWKIAGVNLSVGYFDEHSVSEILHTDSLYRTIDAVEAMLEDVDNTEKFKYVSISDDAYWRKMCNYYMSPVEDDYYNKHSYSSAYRYDSDIFYCHKCKQPYIEDDTFLVKMKDGTKQHFCINCISDNINWCAECGEAFETDHPELKKDYCLDCKNKQK